jgi:hypothetical protein
MVVRPDETRRAGTPFVQEATPGRLYALRRGSKNKLYALHATQRE